MNKINISEAFSTGLGLALGLTMPFLIAKHMFQVFKLPEKAVKHVVVCSRCGCRNPVENRFCGHCGQALYPPPPINCPKCGVPMPSTLNYCWRCGSTLKKTVKTRKKRK
ncbi:MAG: zinc ribbon domain-containing protein [Candidatus Bathyarchaeia archaeon]